MKGRTDKLPWALTVILLISGSANAYIGPGAGVTVIATVLALLGAVVLGIVGFVWYPIKRLRAKLSKPQETEEEETGENSDAKDESA